MTAHATARGDAVVNAMSIDVEDYFQVSAFDRVVSRSAWDGMESRVSANTDRLLALFDEFGIKATFFVLAWVAERHPDIVRRIAAGGHEVASHGYAHRLIYEQTIDEFRDDVRRAKGILEDLAGARVAGYRAPSYSITAKSLWALDVLIEEAVRVRLEHFPDPARSLRDPGRAAPSACAAPNWRHAARGTTVNGSLGIDEPAGCRWRLLPHPAVLVDALGYQPAQSDREAAGDLLSASLGNRSRTAQAAGNRPQPVQALSASRQDRTAVAATPDRLPLRDRVRGRTERGSACDRRT